MKVLLDASVVLRFGLPRDPFHSRVADRIVQLHREGHEICVTPQVLRECWFVMTRPEDSNGFGLSFADASTILAQFLRAFTLLEDPPGMFERWQQILSTHQVLGKQAHDAYHVAAILTHGARAILTLDKRDFERYDGFEILSP